MTFPMDVTKFYQATKQQNRRFYFAMMHVIIQQMNRIENFRYRIEDGKVFDQPIQFVSFTDLIAAGSMAEAKSAGKVRMEGKDYVMHDGDVVEFRFNV